MLGSIAATILRLQPWQPDYDRLVTETEWQGGPHKSWIPLYKPVMTDYEPVHISNEIMGFAVLALLAFFSWTQRNHKVDGLGSRILMGIAIAGMAYMALLWLARQHVEGDWTAVPPRLMRYEIDTPEFLAEEAARKAEWQQLQYKRLGLTPTGEKIWHKVCIYY